MIPTDSNLEDSRSRRYAPKPLTKKDFMPMANVLTKQRNWKMVTEKQNVLSAVEGLKQEFNKLMIDDELNDICVNLRIIERIDKWFPVAKEEKNG